MSAVVWRRSTRCDSGACVEVADTGTDVLMRDSKLDVSPVLTFGRDAWADFIASVKAGQQS
jgi:hypothetical protein